MLRSFSGSNLLHICVHRPCFLVTRPRFIRPRIARYILTFLSFAFSMVSSRFALFAWRCKDLTVNYSVSVMESQLRTLSWNNESCTVISLYCLSYVLSSPLLLMTRKKDGPQSHADSCFGENSLVKHTTFQTWRNKQSF